MILENFGKNIRFTPDDLITPADKNAVLACLERHRDKNLRAVGSLHSWSDSVSCEARSSTFGSSTRWRSMEDGSAGLR